MSERPRPDKIQTLIESLATYRAEGVFNPWQETCPLDLDASAPAARRQRLACHLDAPEIRWLLIGEAAGYQGCRYSGLTFTSERLILEGEVPRIAAPDGRLTRRKRPFSEPSATIVWNSLRLHDLSDQVVLWNAFPWHPMKPGNPLSNRTPTEKELAEGRPLLEHLLALYPQASLVAVGRKAAGTLRSLGLSPDAELRHPAMGGASEFRAGLGKMVARG